MINKKIVTIILIAIVAVGLGGYAALQLSASPPANPEVSPSPSPTVNPTANSSPTATLAPTQSPFSTPTLNPTTNPTFTPTPAPATTQTPTPSPSASATPTPTLSPTPTPSPTAPPVTFPIIVTDDIHNLVTISSYPLRIVSLAPSTTEMVFGLGLGSRIVGTVTYSGYSPSIQNAIKAQNITTVGTFNKVNVEMVTGLQPDLIIASGSYQQTLAETFSARGKTTAILNPTKFQDILADIRLLGKLTGTDTNATNLVNSMQSRVDAVVSKTANLTKPGVYVEYYLDKSGYSSYGANSYINELISMAGGVNVFAGFNGQYVTTSTEEILKANPSIIVISNGVMSNMAGITPDSIRAREGWGGISAVQNNKIYKVDESLLTLWGPRIVDGLEALAQVIHPEIFGPPSTATPAGAFP